MLKKKHNATLEENWYPTWNMRKANWELLYNMKASNRLMEMMTNPSDDTEELNSIIAKIMHE